MADSVGEHSPASDPLVRLLRASVIQGGGLIATSVLSLVMIPVLFHGLGADAYGLWITAAGIAALVSAFDLGLGICVTRDVAARDACSDGEEFVVSAARLYAGLGVVGATIVAGAGAVLASRLGLVSTSVADARLVFVLIAIGLCADVVNMHATSVLAGLNRFGLLNALAIGGMIVRFTGYLALLAADRDVVALAAWQLGASFVTLVAGMVLIRICAPRYRFRLNRFNWTVVRARVSIASVNQFSYVVSTALWRAPAVLVGIVSGSAVAAYFAVSQRLPLAVDLVLCRIADALLPMASARSRTIEATGELLRIGARTTLLFGLPACVFMFGFAREIMTAWLGHGHVSSEMVLTMRLATASVLLECVAHAPEQILFAIGDTKSLVRVSIVRLGTLAVACSVLIPFLGVLGAAVAVLSAIALSSTLCVVLAAKQHAITLPALLSAASRGLVLPSAAAIAIGALAMHLLPSDGMLEIGVATSLASVSYVTVLVLTVPTERALLRKLVRGSARKEPSAP